MAMYRKKPIEIAAVRLSWRTWHEVCAFLGDVISPANPARTVDTYSDTCGEVGPRWLELTISTLEGDMLVRHGDYIIRGTRGELYPCKPAVFADVYEPATAPPAASSRRTEGPWHNRHWSASGDIHISAVGFPALARVSTRLAVDGSITPAAVDEAEANARLITAAPDLLEVVDDLLARVVHADSDGVGRWVAEYPPAAFARVQRASYLAATGQRRDIDPPVETAPRPPEERAHDQPPRPQGH